MRQELDNLFASSSGREATCENWLVFKFCCVPKKSVKMEALLLLAIIIPLEMLKEKGLFKHFLVGKFYVLGPFFIILHIG